MRTMSACCFTEYAKSPGCAIRDRSHTIARELLRKSGRGARSNFRMLWKSRANGDAIVEQEGKSGQARTWPSAAKQDAAYKLQPCSRRRRPEYLLPDIQARSSFSLGARTSRMRNR